VNPETVAALQAAGRPAVVASITDCEVKLAQSTLADKRNDVFQKTLDSIAASAARPAAPAVGDLTEAQLVVLEGLSTGLPELEESVNKVRSTVTRKPL
jgi:hypothetical protein